MNWYYAQGGQQKGPVDDVSLGQLVSNGVVTGTTLVWHDAMPDWQPLSVAAPALVTNAPAIPQIGGVAIPAADKDLYVQQLREGVTMNAPGMLNYAGWWQRFAALLLDGVLVWIFIAITLAAVGGGLYAAGMLSLEDLEQGGEPSPGVIIVGILYYVLAIFAPAVYQGVLGKTGATPGKRVLGIKVVNEDGSQISTGKAWGRGFAHLLNNFTCSIGYLLPLFDDQKRALHDYVCNTRVIQVK
jgi:uncharacterized RDD family membrane protein YckC